MGFIHKFGVAGRGMALLALAANIFTLQGSAAQKSAPPAAASSGPSSVRLEAEQQRKEGDFYFADGKVEIQYNNLRLQADHVQYNTRTYQAGARGHVVLDVDTQHIIADSADFNVQDGAGVFENVHGEISMEHRPNSNMLVSPNPLVFEAREVRRLDARTYLIEHAWLTVCEQDKPNWKFFASHATLHVDRTVALVNADFQMFRIPLLYIPYASLPAGRKLRQSGLLIPEFGDTSVKGLVIGDGYYWAPRDWTDVDLGAAYLSRRGWQQNAQFRAKPWEDVSLSAKYFGVMDRGVPATVVNSSGVATTQLVNQGGHSSQFELNAQLKGGWRAIADLNQLSSLTFQLVFSPTFGEAVRSEVRSAAFLTNNFRGFSANLSATSVENFVNAQPQVSVNLRAAPVARFSSVDQAPWAHLPIYFGVEAFAGGEHRSDETVATDPVTGVQTVVDGIETSSFVERSEFAPRVVIPLHWGPWLGVTPSYVVRATGYGAQLNGQTVVNRPLWRTTSELRVDLRPPTLERVWEAKGGKWKHTIEPDIEYNYVRGVNQFDRFIRFDEDETLTDTNEFLYSITQRLYHRSGDTSANELVSWRIAQKYYFDPTFNGALVPGTRNVFQALTSIAPFAFADEPRHFSPIDSELLVTPGGMYDAEVRLDYDTVRRRLTTAGTLLKIHPTQNFNFTIAHFSIDNNIALQPVANQFRAQAAYGELNRRGWNASVGFGYDLQQHVLQNQFAQVSYNGSCCGIAFEYVRLSLGQIRTENEFRVALNIANIGTFGNLRRQEKLF
jgi:LPS-assembly protein